MHQVSVEARQALARISLVRGGSLILVEPPPSDAELEVLADDYILPTEPVVVRICDFQ